MHACVVLQRDGSKGRPVCGPVVRIPPWVLVRTICTRHRDTLRTRSGVSCVLHLVSPALLVLQPQFRPWVILSDSFGCAQGRLRERRILRLRSGQVLGCDGRIALAEVEIPFDCAQDMLRRFASQNDKCGCSTRELRVMPAVCLVAIPLLQPARLQSPLPGPARLSWPSSASSKAMNRITIVWKMNISCREHR